MPAVKTEANPKRFALITVSLMGLTLFSSANAEPDFKRIAETLAAGIIKQGPVKVAVLTFPHHDHHKSEGPLIISEFVASALAANKKVSVVERHKLNQVLEEMRLSQTSVMDPQSVQAIGRTLGADIIVTGTIINLPNNKCEVNARALLAGSGRVIAAERSFADVTWPERRRLD